MKRTFLIIMAAAITAVFSSVRGQSLEDILNKHFNAVGQEKLTDVNTFIIKAKVSQMGMELPMEMKIKRPNLFRMEMEMQGQKMIQAFDGEKGWMIAPWISSEPQELVGDQLKQAMDQADLDGDLYNYEKKGSTADFIGKVSIGGKEAYKIKLAAKNGNVKNYFIDADTYLVLKVNAKISAMGQTVEVEQRMMNYKTIDGVKMATKIESDSPMGTAVVTMEEIIFNEKLDDLVFKQ